jgi:hypothetical protein
MSKTFWLFCAVRQEIAEAQYVFSEVAVFMSACTPAPPQESEPAIISILFFILGIIF